MSMIDQAIETIHLQLPPFWNVVFGCHEAAMREMNRQPAPEGQDGLELFIHYYQAIADHAGWETAEPLHLALTLSLYRQNSGRFWLTEKDCLQAALLLLNYITTPAYGEDVSVICGRAMIEYELLEDPGSHPDAHAEVPPAQRE